MKIKVYNCHEKIVGIIFLSYRGWENYEAFEEGKGLKESFELYKYGTPIPQKHGGQSESDGLKSYYTYSRDIHFGDKRYLGALSDMLSNFGEFILFWNKEMREKLFDEYERFIESIEEKAA